MSIAPTRSQRLGKPTATRLGHQVAAMTCRSVRPAVAYWFEYVHLGAETDICAHTDANMLDMLDSGLGNVSSALTASGMWSNTLLVFSAVRHLVVCIRALVWCYADSVVADATAG